MKKFFTIVGLLVVCLFVVGCSPLNNISDCPTINGVSASNFIRVSLLGVTSATCFYDMANADSCPALTGWRSTIESSLGDSLTCSYTQP